MMKRIVEGIQLDRLSMLDLWYIIPFSVWLILSCFSISFYYTFFSTYFVLVNCLCAWILLTREIFLLSWARKKDLHVLLLTIVIMSLFFQNKNYVLMTLILIIFCMRNTDLKKIGWIVFLITGACFLAIVVSSKVGIIQDFVEAGRNRHYLGFRYSLYGPTIYFNLCALLIYLRKTKIHWLTLCLMLAGNILLYKLTDARLCFGFTVILLVMAGIYKKNYHRLKEWNWVYWLMAASFIGCLIVTFVLIRVYDPSHEMLAKINSLFSNRLGYTKESIRRYGFTWLPQTIQWVGNGLNMEGVQSAKEYLYVDNFYIHYLQQFGVVIFSIITAMVTKLLVTCKKYKDLYLASIVSLLCLHGIVDDLLFAVYYNAFFMISVYTFTDSKKLNMIYQCLMVGSYAWIFYMMARYFMLSV